MKYPADIDTPTDTLLHPQVVASVICGGRFGQTHEQAVGSIINNSDRRSYPSPQPVAWGRAIPELCQLNPAHNAQGGWKEAKLATCGWLCRRPITRHEKRIMWAAPIHR